MRLFKTLFGKSNKLKSDESDILSLVLRVTNQDSNGDRDINLSGAATLLLNINEHTFFTDINSREAQSSRVVPNGSNSTSTTGRLAVEITDSSLLPAGRWTLQFIGDGRSFELIDQASGKTVNQGRLPDPVQSEIGMPGFNIRVEGGTFNAGDKYLQQAPRNLRKNSGCRRSGYWRFLKMPLIRHFCYPKHR